MTPNMYSEKAGINRGGKKIRGGLGFRGIEEELSN